jgi:hypothetical protein
VHAKKLPLFSAIPFAPLLTPMLEDPTTWTFIVFGTIHPDWSYETLFQQIDVARHRHGISRCRFVSIGNCGVYGRSLWDSLKSCTPNDYPAFTFNRLGELSADSVSYELQKADFGLAMSPTSLVEKSSAIAAYLAHGLPIVVSRITPDYVLGNQSLKDSDSFVLLDADFIDSLVCARKSPPVDLLGETANQFIADLHLLCN